MEYTRSLLKIALLGILFIIVTYWYSGYTSMSPDEQSITISNTVSYEEAKEKLNRTPSIHKEYYYEYTMLIKRQRTSIPFKYKIDTLQMSRKTLYERDR